MDELVPFGPKNAWIAVLDRSPGRVAAALDLAGGVQEDFADAVEASYGMDLAVLPALPGVDGDWTIAVGEGLYDVSERFVADLSARLDTPVQAFVTHRVSESHGWMAADAGRLRRRLEVCGERNELVAWTGAPTSVEVRTGLPDWPEAPVGDEAVRVVATVSETTVMQVAGAWSVDPDRLRGPAPGPALVFEDPGLDDEQAPAATTPQTGTKRGLWSRLTRR